MDFTYIVQASLDGLAQAHILTEDFFDGAPLAMVLADNIFFGHGLPKLLEAAGWQDECRTVFGYHAVDPGRDRVVAFDADGKASEIIEKPEIPPSSFAVNDLHFLDGEAPAHVSAFALSARGELKIATLLQNYIVEGTLTVQTMGRGGFVAQIA